MNAVAPDKQISFGDGVSGEIEIEKVPSVEIEIKRKDLLPVIEHFHNANPSWINRFKVLPALNSFLQYFFDNHLDNVYLEEKAAAGTGFLPTLLRTL